MNLTSRGISGGLALDATSRAMERGGEGAGEQGTTGPCSDRGTSGGGDSRHVTGQCGLHQRAGVLRGWVGHAVRVSDASTARHVGQGSAPITRPRTLSG